MGDGWLTRRQLFERTEEARANDTTDVLKTRRLGPMLMVALALLVACVMLGAVASALVISPSIARTRRSIAEAYRPSPTPAPTEIPTATVALEVTATAIVSEPTAIPETKVEIAATPTLLPTVTAPQVAVAQSPTPVLPPTQAPTLPPTFTPVAVAVTLTPTVQSQVTATPTVTATISPTISPLGSPLTTTPTATPTPLPGGQVAPTPTPATPVGSVVFQGSIQITNIRFQGTELNEADEYVELRNTGSQPVVLDGFSLKAIRLSDNQIIDQYIFGNGFVMATGQTCRVYTAKLSTTDNCGTGTGFDNPAPIWPNSPGAKASLVSPQNVEQARFTY